MPRKKVNAEAIRLANKIPAEKQKPLSAVDIADDLVARYDEYERKSAFSAGELVRFKPGLCNRPTLPASAKVMIVMELLDDSVYPERFEEAAAINSEVLDVKVGFLMARPNHAPVEVIRLEHLDLVTMLVDGKRLEKVTLSKLVNEEEVIADGE